MIMLGRDRRRMPVSLSGTGAEYSVGSYIATGSSYTVVFGRGGQVRVRVSAGGYYGGAVGYITQANGSGGGAGAYNDTGVVVNVKPGRSYSLSIGGIGGSGYFYDGLSDDGQTAGYYILVYGGSSGVGGAGAGGPGGAGGVSTYGAGGTNGATGAVGYSGVNGADATGHAGAAGGSGNDGGSGAGNGGNASGGSGEAGGGYEGGSGCFGYGATLTGDSSRGGGGGGGQGDGNPTGGLVGRTAYVYSATGGRATIEIVAIY